MKDLSEVQQKVVVHAPAKDVLQFGIAAQMNARIFNILRYDIYSRPILACLREYIANAVDAHVAAGIPEVPVRVSLPTKLSPVLIIRDFGKGLDNVQIKDLIEYGASTKRDTNDEAGYFGIGAKAAFSYSDTYTVVTYNGGTKTSYTALLDDTREGILQKMAEAPSSETGVEIRIPVQKEDIEAFRREATYCCQALTPVPEGLEDLPFETPPEHRTPYGWLLPRGGWIALVGWIPYKLDLSRCQTQLEELGMWHILATSSGVLKFDIGEVEISASREELHYSAPTLKAIAAKLNDMVHFHWGNLGTQIEEAKTVWDQRLAVQAFQGLFTLMLPEKYRSFGEPWVTLDTWVGHKDQFNNPIMGVNGKQEGHYLFRISSSKLVVSPKTRIIIRDANIRLSQVGLQTKKGGVSVYDVIVSPDDGQTLAAMREALDKALLQAEGTGVPIVLLSSLPKIPRVPRTKSKQAVPCHYLQTYTGKWLSCGENEPQPDATTPYIVELKRGQFYGFDRWSQESAARYLEFFSEFCSLYGVERPEIFKYSSKHQKKAVGIPLKEWLTLRCREVLKSGTRLGKDFQTVLRKNISGCVSSYELDLEPFQSRLGNNHPVVQMFSEQLEASKRACDYNHITSKYKDILLHLSSLLELQDTHSLLVEEVFKKYPLLGLVARNKYLFRTNEEHWLDYILYRDGIK